MSCPKSSQTVSLSFFLVFLVAGCIPQQLPTTTVAEENAVEENRKAGEPEETEPELLEVVAVTASDFRNEHVPANSLDGDLDTRWSAAGDGAWIRYDLGRPFTLTAVAIAWYKGDKRVAEFDIEVSDDGEQWNYVFGGVSSGELLSLERHLLAPVTARYVRIVGHGNSENLWNSITEVEIEGYQDLANHAPKIAGIPAPVVDVGEAYRFQPEVRDPDGDGLIFDIENKPAWAVFDSATGVLGGTPDVTDIGTVEGIVISVTDGSKSDRVGPFSITVREKEGQNSSASIPEPFIRKQDGMIEETFESGDYSASGFNTSGAPPVVTADSHPVFEGRRSLQIFLDRNDRKTSPSPYRRELKLVNKRAGMFRNLDYGKEYWVGFAIYLADDYQMPGTKDILFQLHDVPDQHLGESYKNPNLTLAINGLTRDEARKHLVHQWVVSIKGDDRELTPTGDKRYYPTRLAIPVAPAAEDVGRWVTWVFNFKVTWKPDGFVKVWKDGELVLEKYDIRTAFNDVTGPYLNIGSYKPSWKRPGDSKNPNLKNSWQNPFAADEAPSRLSYLDAFRIATGQDRYRDVAP